MFTIDVRGIDRLVAQLEQRKEDYQVAVDEAAKFARDTIINRARLGQLVDGSYRETRSLKRIGRYSQRQGRFRRSVGIPTGVQTLSVTGALYRNFVVQNGRSINRKNPIFERTVGFTNQDVVGRNISYSELADIHEQNGVTFQLSPSQFIRVMARFKQVARL